MENKREIKKGAGLGSVGNVLKIREELGLGLRAWCRKRGGLGFLKRRFKMVYV